jgi:1,2-diacylglycerol 3-beta-glucosyltransferase
VTEIQAGHASPDDVAADAAPADAAPADASPADPAPANSAAAVAPTPDAWRVAALGMLVGGAAIGWRAASGRGTGLLVGGAVTTALAAAVPIALASRRPPIPPDAPPLAPTAPPPTFSVVIAARDEAVVVPGLLGDLGRQDHRTSDGRPQFEVIVIDDRSTDGTAQAALRAAGAAGLGDVTRLVRRHGEVPDGKGAALTAVPPEDCRGDVVVVLDADARVGPAFLATLARYVAAGADAVTARRRILGPERSHLAGAQADEQTVDGELQRGRWARGGCSEFRGNGIVIRRDLLLRAGGWRAEALAEDLDLSSRVALVDGTRVAWALDAEVWEEPVTTWDALWKQRVRWAEGALRRAFEHGRAMLTSRRLPLAARLDFAAYVGQLVAPPLILGALGGALRSGRVWAAAALVGAYAGVAAILGFDALRWESDGHGTRIGVGERVGRAGRVALFGAIWLAAVPAGMWRLATRRGAVLYDKMDHDGGRHLHPAATPAPPVEAMADAPAADPVDATAAATREAAAP